MRKVINFVLTIVMCVFFGLALKEMYLYWNVKIENEELREQVIGIPSVDVPDVPKEDIENGSEDVINPFERSIDFDTLSAINSDILGWIYIPGTMVDYPILSGDEDLKYENRNFRGSNSKLGSIFGYSGIDLNADNHVVLFGHNMASSQMFGGLKKYKDNDYALNHMKVYIYTKDRIKECTLISRFSCDKTDSIFLKSNAKKSVEELVGGITSRSNYAFECPDVLGQVFSLSTCNGKVGTSRRLILNFMVTQEKYVF